MKSIFSDGNNAPSFEGERIYCTSILSKLRVPVILRIDGNYVADCPFCEFGSKKVFNYNEQNYYKDSKLMTQDYSLIAFVSIEENNYFYCESEYCEVTRLHAFDYVTKYFVDRYPSDDFSQAVNRTASWLIENYDAYTLCQEILNINIHSCLWSEKDEDGYSQYIIHPTHLRNILKATISCNYDHIKDY